MTQIEIFWTVVNVTTIGAFVVAAVIDLRRTYIETKNPKP